MKTAPSRSAEISGLGLRLSPITEELRGKYQLSQDQKGVVVTDVVTDGTAAGRGLKPGDVIVEVQQEAVNSPGDVQERRQRQTGDRKRRDAERGTRLETSAETDSDRHPIPQRSRAGSVTMPTRSTPARRTRSWRPSSR